MWFCILVYCLGNVLDETSRFIAQVHHRWMRPGKYKNMFTSLEEGWKGRIFHVIKLGLTLTHLSSPPILPSAARSLIMIG